MVRHFLFPLSCHKIRLYKTICAAENDIIKVNVQYSYILGHVSLMQEQNICQSAKRAFSPDQGDI